MECNPGKRERGWVDGGCDQSILYTCMKLSKRKIKILKKILFSVARFCAQRNDQILKCKQDTRWFLENLLYGFYGHSYLQL